MSSDMDMMLHNTLGMSYGVDVDDTGFGHEVT